MEILFLCGWAGNCVLEFLNIGSKFCRIVKNVKVLRDWFLYSGLCVLCFNGVVCVLVSEFCTLER